VTAHAVGMDELRAEFERIARHEAAHAVVARVLGFTVTRVYLHEGGGNCDNEGGGFGDDFYARVAVIAMAGAAADRAAGFEGAGSAGDRALLCEHTARLRQPFDVEGKADELVAEHEREIDFVTVALFNAGELSGEQVDQLMAVARGDEAA
jgi:hypothetical protein